MLNEFIKKLLLFNKYNKLKKLSEFFKKSLN